MASVRVTILGLVFLSACSSDKLIKFQQIDTFRILALTASQPEVSPLSAPIITVYVADPNGAGRGLTLEAVACIDPGISYGAEPSCTGSATATTLLSATSVGAPGTAPHYVGALATSVTVPIPAASIIYAGRSANQQHNGVSYLVVVTVTASGGEQVRSFKRIVVSTRSVPNSNPVIQDVLIEGVSESMQTMPTSKAKFLVTAAGIAEESYDEYDTLGSLQTRTEELSVVWLATQGVFTNAKGDLNQSNSYTPKENPAASTAFVMILKDNRGGAALSIFQK
jgi:hypothetical protein